MLGDTIDGKAQLQDLFQDLGTILCTLAGILVVMGVSIDGVPQKGKVLM